MSPGWDWSALASNFDCGIRCYWDARALRAAGTGARSHRWNVSLRHVADQPQRVFLAGAHRAVYAESHRDSRGLAGGDCRRLFWRVHDVFDFWLGDGEDA